MMNGVSDKAIRRSLFFRILFFFFPGGRNTKSIRYIISLEGEMNNSGSVIFDYVITVIALLNFTKLERGGVRKLVGMST